MNNEEPKIIDNADNTNNDTSNSNNTVAPTIVYKKVRNNATIFLLLVIACLFGACYYFNKEKEDTINYYKNVYSPINTKEETSLDINSTLVLSLYNRVKTTILEDIANPNIDDTMKRYLAYRNLSTDAIYSSNCNLFKNSGLKNFECDDKDYIPLAFKEDDLLIKYKEIFGEEYVIPHGNIQLSSSCLGGFEYIPERKEYVQGKCNKVDKALIKVDKSLLSASSTESTIKIVESVRYYKAGGEIPQYLKNGEYTYTFRLDKNFNYIFVSKELTDERG